MIYGLQGCKKSAVIGWMAGMLLVAGCTQDKLADASQGEMLPEGKYPVTFIATGLEISAATRATAEGEWKTSNEVAVQVESESAKKYKPGSDSASVTLKAADTPFYWKSTSDINVTAWYFGAEYKASLPNSWSVESNQNSDDSYPKSDVLYAHGTLSFDGSKPLTFYHQVAKVVVHVLKGNDTPENLNITELKANNLCLTCEAWTAPTEEKVYGTVTARKNPQDINSLSFDAGEITLPGNSKATPLGSYKFLIVPQDVNSGAPLFTITAQGYGAPFIYTPTSTQTLKAGNEYTYYITIKGSKVIATVTTNIGWTEDSATGGGSVEI